MEHIILVNGKTAYYVRDISQLFTFVLCGVSILSTTAISADRLLALSLGLRYRHIVTLRRVRALIICFWLIGASVGLVYYFWSYFVSLVIALVVVILSVVISIFSYTKIFFRLRQHQDQLRGSAFQAQPNEGGGIPLNVERYRRTVSTIVWLQLALVACYAPFVVVAMMINISGWSKINDMIWLTVGTLGYLNSSLNPFLYCWKIREVRQAVKDTARQFCSSST